MVEQVRTFNRAYRYPLPDYASRSAHGAHSATASKRLRHDPAPRGWPLASKPKSAATASTTYLQNGGKLEVAQQMAGHEYTRTTGLYDRRNDSVALDEVERIAY